MKTFKNLILFFALIFIPIQLECRNIDDCVNEYEERMEEIEAELSNDYSHCPYGEGGLCRYEARLNYNRAVSQSLYEFNSCVNIYT